MNLNHPPALLARAITWCTLLAAAGCGGSRLPATHPGEGKVVYKGGPIAELQGGRVEFQLVSDPSIIAVGDIQADGSFALQTWSADGAAMSAGVPAGEHQVRVLPPRPREEASQRLIHPRFQGFDTSGIRVTIPSEAIEIVVASSDR